MLNNILLLIILILVTACGDGSVQSSQSANGSSGIAGSMARFSIKDDVMYAIIRDEIQIFDISESELPKKQNRLKVDFGIETLFLHHQYLFVGSQTGVYIFDTRTSDTLYFISEFPHVRSCDPVIVQGDYAFVTLRSNSRCWGSKNQLDILNISDVYNPTLVMSYPMEEPYGLAVKQNLLFLCDGMGGLKVFNVENKSEIINTQTFNQINCFDAISYKDTLIVSADFGLLQFEIKDASLELLSNIFSSKKLFSNLKSKI